MHNFSLLPGFFCDNNNNDNLDFINKTVRCDDDVKNRNILE
mgnify:CR=1 FL=1